LKLSLDNIISNSEEKAKKSNKALVSKGFSSHTQSENNWVTSKMIEEITSASLITSEDKHPIKSRKKRASLGRDNQIKTRLTDSEMVTFQKRVQKSGLSQGEYMRSAVLQGQIIVKEENYTDILLIDELALLRAEVGRQGGLLKMLIRPNEGQRELNPSEWNELISYIRQNEDIKNTLAKLEEEILNGHHHP